jgi:hypothetical protein
MKKVFDGTNFVGEIVLIDNAKFINCRFEGCTLNYSGGPWSIEHCAFSGDTAFALQGQAYQAMLFLKYFDMIKPGKFADPSQAVPKRVN